MTILLTYDLGGTSLRYGLYSTSERQLLMRQVCPTPNYQRSGTRQSVLLDQVIDAMCHAAFALIAQSGQRPEAVVAGVPGPGNEEGLLLGAPTILGEQLSRPYPFKARLSAAVGLPTTVVNDITAAGYRYACDGQKDFCLISIGSGIGAKLFLNSVPVLGASLDAGELGHVKWSSVPDAPMCDCGEIGHIGAYASGRGVASLVQAQANKDPSGFAASRLAGTATNTMDIAQAFITGDHWTTNCVETSLIPLAAGLAATRSIVGVECYIVIGGFAFAVGTPYLSMLARQCNEHYNWPGWGTAFQMGYVDDDNGLVGAGRYGEDRRNA
ncbi:transcriptional repressor/ROK family [Candidatus Paraburkholderia calva]|nr:transcriptional repressor/ROK family [Candidatus Paraburkholderia calva]